MIKDRIANFVKNLSHGEVLDMVKIKLACEVIYDTIEQKIMDQSEFESFPEERSSNKFMYLDINY